MSPVSLSQWLRENPKNIDAFQGVIHVVIDPQLAHPQTKLRLPQASKPLDPALRGPLGLVSKMDFDGALGRGPISRFQHLDVGDCLR